MIQTFTFAFTDTTPAGIDQKISGLQEVVWEGIYSIDIPVSYIQGMDNYLSFHLNNKLDWKNNTDISKGRADFTCRRLQDTLLRTFLTLCWHQPFSKEWSAVVAPSLLLKWRDSTDLLRRPPLSRDSCLTLWWFGGMMTKLSCLK